MTTFFFASDLHGQPHRYDALFEAIDRDRPEAVLLGGDLLPLGGGDEFIDGLAARFAELHANVILILGNDDPRAFEPLFREHEDVWTVLHSAAVEVAGYRVYGYPFVPPTPFALKDWERYDVSHFVDPGCISPEDGVRSVDVEPNVPRYSTIADDLERLAGAGDLERAIFLFHSPPYRTKLDRAALDGQSVEHVPLDVNVGSIAIRRFIEAKQPLLTLHGHVHESARLTGAWKDRIGRTVLLGGAHDGPELALVRFDPEQPDAATRELL